MTESHNITDLPENQEEPGYAVGGPTGPSEERQAPAYTPGQVVIAETDTVYSFTDSTGPSVDDIPAIRRAVMATRLRGIADLLD